MSARRDSPLDWPACRSTLLRAPQVAASVFARRLLDRVVTRSETVFLDV